MQYAAKEYQQALDILDMEEAASKRLLDKNVKEDNGSRETVKEWEMSPASVSLTPYLLGFFFFLSLNMFIMFYAEFSNKLGIWMA